MINKAHPMNHFKERHVIKNGKGFMGMACPGIFSLNNNNTNVTCSIISFQEDQNILNHYKCIYFVHQLEITIY